jgi:hypothetical protein
VSVTAELMSKTLQEYLSYSGISGDTVDRKTPPKRSLDGAPARNLVTTARSERRLRLRRP